MTDQKKDRLDSLIDFILSDDSPVTADDQPDLDLFEKALTAAESKIARERLARARTGAAFSHAGFGGKVDMDRGRHLLARAKAGDPSMRVTLAARFGDGSMEGDMEAIAEDLAELDAESREED